MLTGISLDRKVVLGDGSQANAILPSARCFSPGCAKVMGPEYSKIGRLAPGILSDGTSASGNLSSSAFLLMAPQTGVVFRFPDSPNILSLRHSPGRNRTSDSI